MTVTGESIADRHFAARHDGLAGTGFCPVPSPAGVLVAGLVSDDHTWCQSHGKACSLVSDLVMMQAAGALEPIPPVRLAV